MKARAPEAKTKKAVRVEAVPPPSAPALQSELRFGQKLFEKCELKLARERFEFVVSAAREQGDARAEIDAMSMLLRTSAEALDHDGVERWSGEIHRWVQRHPRSIPSSIWYHLGAQARTQRNWQEAFDYFMTALRELRKDPLMPKQDRLEMQAKSLTGLASTLINLGRPERAVWVARKAIEKFGSLKVEGAIGQLLIVIALVDEQAGRLDSALKWYQKAHQIILSERNWYAHLYLLYAYARIARMKSEFEQAEFYLGLIEAVASTDEFGVIRREVIEERKRLAECTIDLELDEVTSKVKTRESTEINFGKQHILLEILKALLAAHEEGISESERGLTKGQIVQRVWRTGYRPSAHDNKLYYNINRLRKLIEPDVHHPKYLLNWRDGYRIAPGLRTRLRSLDRGMDPSKNK